MNGTKSLLHTLALRVTCLALVMTTPGCSLIKPGCGNRNVRTGIEQDAKKSIDLWLASENKAFTSSDAKIVVSGTHETSSRGDSRFCSATVKIGAQNDAIGVPIEYEVINTDDGQVLYRWDADSFGKSFIGTALMSVLENLARAPTPPAAKSSPDGAADAAAAAAQEASRLTAKVNKWRGEVSDKINAQASKFAIDGSGTVSVRFDISAEGNISGIKVTQSSGSPGLDATAVRMVESAGPVAPPPDRQARGFTKKLSFL